MRRHFTKQNRLVYQCDFFLLWFHINAIHNCDFAKQSFKQDLTFGRLRKLRAIWKKASYSHGLKASYRILQSFKWRENFMPFFKSEGQLFCLSCFALYVPPRCRCTRLCCTYPHSLTHTQSVGLLWTRDRPQASDFYLTKHNAHNRETSMLPAGFETTIPASERPQTQALDCTANGIGTLIVRLKKDRRIQWVPYCLVHIWILPSHLYGGVKRPSHKINLKFYYQYCIYDTALNKSDFLF